jgi:putative transposase
MYNWRKMTDEMRADVLGTRRLRNLPWHAPPHDSNAGIQCYLVTAACFEHAAIIGKSPRRMAEFEETLLSVCNDRNSNTFAWCVLPNHYHVLVRTDELERLLAAIGQMHGRCSYSWNGEDAIRGRQVWHSCMDRRMRSSRHFWATVNYVHHNPVRHGYTDCWQGWPYSSATSFVASRGREEAIRIWTRYPVGDYGEGWDPAEC